MVEIRTIRSDTRFDSGSVDTLFADPGAAVADAEGFLGERSADELRVRFPVA